MTVHDVAHVKLVMHRGARGVIDVEFPDGVLLLFAAEVRIHPSKASPRISQRAKNPGISRHATRVRSMNVRSALVIDLPKRGEQRESKPLASPLVSQLLAKAERWQVEIDRGEVRNRAAIARREGLSEVYVGHLLRLLRLHPDIRTAIAALPHGTPPRLLSERKLRPIMTMSWDRQLLELGWLLERRRRA